MLRTVVGPNRYGNLMPCKVIPGGPIRGRNTGRFLCMEILRDIPDYVGIYQVSNLGSVRRIKRYKAEPGILRFAKTGIGYLRVCLSKDCKTKSFLVHRLVAIAFVPNPDALPYINHKNEIKTDNRAENLEWCTQKYNNNYGTARFRSSVTQSTPVVQLTTDGKKIREFYGMHEAERETGVCVQNIHKCCNGVYKTAGGYKWKYVL